MYAFYFSLYNLIHQLKFVIKAVKICPHLSILNVSRDPNQASLLQQGVHPERGEGHSLPESHPQL